MKSENKAHFSDLVQGVHTKHGHFVNYDVIADKVHTLIGALSAGKPREFVTKAISQHHSSSLLLLHT